MFAPYCASCQSRVLLGPTRIVQFTDAGTGLIDVVLRCWCGAEVPADATAAPVGVAEPATPVPAARLEYATNAAPAC